MQNFLECLSLTIFKRLRSGLIGFDVYDQQERLWRIQSARSCTRVKVTWRCNALSSAEENCSMQAQS